MAAMSPLATRFHLLTTKLYLRRLSIGFGIALAAFAGGGFLFLQWNKPSLGIGTDLAVALLVGAFGFVAGWLHFRLLGWLIGKLRGQ